MLHQQSFNYIILKIILIKKFKLLSETLIIILYLFFDIKKKQKIIINNTKQLLPIITRLDYLGLMIVLYLFPKIFIPN